MRSETIWYAVGGILVTIFLHKMKKIPINLAIKGVLFICIGIIVSNTLQTNLTKASYGDRNTLTAVVDPFVEMSR